MLAPARGRGLTTRKPRQGRNAATVSLSSLPRSSGLPSFLLPFQNGGIGYIDRVMKSMPLPASRRSRPLVLRSVILLALAAGTVAFCIYGTPKPGVSEAGITLDLPTQIGDFTGEDLPVSESELEILPKDTQFAKKAYSAPDGRSLSCQIVLAGSEKQSIHRPQICLRAQGWTIKSEDVIPVKLADGSTLEVMRLLISRPVELRDGSKGTVNSVYMYWFVGKGTTTPHHHVRILKTSLDLLLTNTNHRWAYVIASAPVMAGLAPGGLSQPETEKMLSDFIAKVYPSILKHGDDRPAPAAP